MGKGVVEVINVFANLAMSVSSESLGVSAVNGCVSLSGYIG